MRTLIAIWNESSVVKWMALVFVVGLGFIGYGQLSGLPSRTSLTSVEGTVTGASKVTKKRRRTGSMTVTFELALRPSKAGEAEMKLVIPANEIGETDVRSVIGKVVRAEFDSESDVYVLMSAGRELLKYESAIESRKLGLRQYHVDGIAMLLGSSAVGGIMALITFFRLRRRAAQQGLSPEAES
jgi:hypothetical protein